MDARLGSIPAGQDLNGHGAQVRKKPPQAVDGQRDAVHVHSSSFRIMIKSLMLLLEDQQRLAELQQRAPECLWLLPGDGGHQRGIGEAAQ